MNQVDKCSANTTRNGRCKYDSKKEGLCTMHYNKKNGQKREKRGAFKDEDKCEGIAVSTKERCKRKKKFGNLCSYHFKTQEFHYINHEGETKECMFVNHGPPSVYAKDKVPIEKFYIKNDPNNIAKFCADCRNRRNEIRSKKINNIVESEKDSDYKTCMSNHHNISVSKYPKNKVPRILFMKERKKGEFIESLNCQDCRNYFSIMKLNRIKKGEEDALREGKFYCKTCSKKYYPKDMATLKTGEISKFCHDCQIKNNVKGRRVRQETTSLYYKIKKEKLLGMECSCNMCNRIFLKPEKNTTYPVKLNTYIEDEIRYVIYNDVKYSCKDFISQYENFLDLRVLDLDHLNEKEQRERGIIKEGEKYIKKKCGVSIMRCEKDMRDEAKITQLLCIECHIMVGNLRRRTTGSYNEDKLRLVTEARKSGCQSCGWYRDDLLRYLEFDHIDPSSKIDNVSTMLRRKKYTVEELGEEIKKCRVLCRTCHRIHTFNEQRKKMKEKEMEYLKQEKYLEEIKFNKVNHDKYYHEGYEEEIRDFDGNGRKDIWDYEEYSEYCEENYEDQYEEYSEDCEENYEDQYEEYSEDCEENFEDQCSDN